jgi:hypothetical protein
MAETYKISQFLTYTNRSGHKTLGGVVISDDAGYDDVLEEQTIGGAPELLNVGEAITSAGLKICCIQNLDDIYSVTVYSDNGVTELTTIDPGGARIFKPDGAYIPYLKAPTGKTVQIKHLSVSVPAPFI